MENHEEDKINNPDRHNPQKDKYSWKEAQELCPWCIPNFSDKYEYHACTAAYYRIVKDD
jgi:uncharacterized protein CbrC (UPF0167 family)